MRVGTVEWLISPISPVCNTLLSLSSPKHSSLIDWTNECISKIHSLHYIPEYSTQRLGQRDKARGGWCFCCAKLRLQCFQGRILESPRSIRSSSPLIVFRSAPLSQAHPWRMPLWIIWLRQGERHSMAIPLNCGQRLAQRSFHPIGRIASYLLGSDICRGPRPDSEGSIKVISARFSL